MKTIEATDDTPTDAAAIFDLLARLPLDISPADRQERPPQEREAIDQI